MPVKKSLFATGAGLFALLLAACTQQTEPKEVEIAVSPVVEEAATETVKPKKSSRRKAKEEKAELPAPPAEEVKPESAPVEPPPTVLPTPAFSPVEMTASFVPSAPGKRIARVNVPGPYVAVTFDDGPSASLTPKVLDIFKRHGAHATFFVLGRNAANNRSLLARAVAEGHEVGSHTWSHINMRASGTDKIFSELDRTNAVIERATGSRPKVMRPPYGSVNRNLVDMVYKRYGTPAILWDVDTNDWRKPGVQTVINRAVNRAQPGSIILLHDIHPSTIAAVEGIVTGLQARGFKLVTVSELIALGRGTARETPPAELPQETPAPATAEPAMPTAEVQPSLHAQQQQQQQLPEGAASIGATPATVAPPVEAVAPPAEPVSQPAEADFEFFES